MSLLAIKFWEYFKQKDFINAQEQFGQLDNTEKEAIFSELFQKSEYYRMPDMVSILHRKLHDGKEFDDFHQAWFPSKKWTSPLQQFGQTFQQFFPAPTRVINAVNIKNPNEILSVGLTWVNGEEQAKEMWKVVTADSQANEERHNSTAKVANKISSDVYEIKSDDNLGVPF